MLLSEAQVLEGISNVSVVLVGFLLSFSDLFGLLITTRDIFSLRWLCRMIGI